jgi:hypothetical protein
MGLTTTTTTRVPFSHDTKRETRVWKKKRIDNSLNEKAEVVILDGIDQQMPLFQQQSVMG